MLSDYDRSLRVAGLGLYPWPRLGPEKWFDHYAIVSVRDWDLPHEIGNLKVESLDSKDPSIKQASYLVNSEAGEQLISKSSLKDFKLLPYKPFTLPVWLPEDSILAVDKNLSDRFENKAYFREDFKDIAPFPDYIIVSKTELANRELYEEFIGQFGIFLLQDNVLSGGQGTFKVTNKKEYHRAVDELIRQRGDKVVISKYLPDIIEASVQAAVLKDGIAIGPLQEQFVGEKLLCAPNGQIGDKFCGVQVQAEPWLDQKLQGDIYTTVKKIGTRLKESGYKGIFGVDLLINKAKDRFYIIEVNARTTGATPLHSMFDKHKSHIPFYPLHILELAKCSYTLDPMALAKQGSFEHDCSMLVLHVRDNREHYLENVPKSGKYTRNKGGLEFVGSEPYFNSDDIHDTLILQVHPGAATHANPGARLAFVFMKSLAKAENGKFTTDTGSLIEEIYSMFGLTKIPK